MKSKVLSVLTLLLLGTTLVGGVEAQAATTSNCNGTINRRVINMSTNNIDITNNLYSIIKLINSKQNKYFNSLNGSITKKDEVILPETAQKNETSTVVTTPKDETTTSVTTPKEEVVTKETAKNDTVVKEPATNADTAVTKPANETSVVNDKFMAEVEQAIYKKVNEERAKAGASTLSYNTTMEKYARIKSQDMGDNNYFSHPDLQGNLITTKLKADGVSYKSWGENIAYIGGVSDPTALANQFMTNWMNSQGHRENILSTNFESIGVGVYQIGNKVYATQEFYR